MVVIQSLNNDLSTLDVCLWLKFLSKSKKEIYIKTVPIVDEDVYCFNSFDLSLIINDSVKLDTSNTHSYWFRKSNLINTKYPSKSSFDGYINIKEIMESVFLEKNEFESFVKDMLSLLSNYESNKINCLNVSAKLSDNSIFVNA